MTRLQMKLHSLFYIGAALFVSGCAAHRTYTLALSAEWEADAVGRLTAAARSARATAAMYADARQAVQTQLVATIANSYYTLLLLDAQDDICRRSAEV